MIKESVMRDILIVAAAAAALIFLAGTGCRGGESAAETERVGQEGEVTEAVAVLHPAEGHEVRGKVSFVKHAGGILITADVEGLTPGLHGFHIHEFGDCSAADATSAGGHFNPDNKPHGSPEDIDRHAGDLGNLDADAEGRAHYERVDGHIALSGPRSIVGLAVIVHAGEDDFTSQPTGNAGARVACGVIGVANPGK